MPKNIEKQTGSLESTELPPFPPHWTTVDGESVKERIEDVPRRLVVRKVDREAGFVTPFHSHGWGQLLWIVEGLVQVSARDIGHWVVPPQRAVWIPPFIEHDARAIQSVKMRNIYIAPQAAGRLPEQCQVVSVSPLMRELMVTMAEFDRLYDEEGAEGRLVSVFLDQFELLPEAALHLPEPTSAPLRTLAEQLRQDPANKQPLASWGRQLGMSERTLARRFQQETGMSFGQWRQQARLLEALSRIAQGQPVALIAQDLGYDSQSAFIAMFRKALGRTPGRYF
ncbi:AraC family transcriptional regulator [Motiliproteus sp.]|uniref:AraC family transcriptional regulator n=1 Tax=Motiliproteus sp. TaxID=1898955 RepID=UPI003BAD6DF4